MENVELLIPCRLSSKSALPMATPLVSVRISPLASATDAVKVNLVDLPVEKVAVPLKPKKGTQNIRLTGEMKIPYS